MTSTSIQRNFVALNDAWLFNSGWNHAMPTMSSEDFAALEHSVGVRLPHNGEAMPLTHFDVSSYCHLMTYKRKLPIAPEWKGRRVVLRFEGVMLACWVYVNGQLVGEHFGGYTPFDIDLSQHMGDARELDVTVKVDGSERADTPPFGKVVDYLSYAGMYREVQLIILPRLHLHDPYMSCEISGTAAPVLRAEGRLAGAAPDLVESPRSAHDAPARSSARVRLGIYDDGQLVAQGDPVPVGDDGRYAIELRELTVQLWDVENPKLYSIRLELLGSDGEVLDSMEQSFGFRDAEFRTDGFYLNGKNIDIRGLNRHQSYPHQGYAMPKSQQYRDAEILKWELGVNMVRCSHYPQSRHFLDRCDQIGLLVFSELPGWQHIGEGEWKERAVQSVREMVLRDRNRPSVVIWGVRINESPDDDQLFSRTNALAKQLDPHRQTGGVRNFPNSKLLEDVYTYNDFVHSGANRGVESPRNIAGKRVPYLITEHNGHMYPTKKFDNQDRRTEQALRHLRVLDSAHGNRGISGAIGWCMFDYQTHKDFGSGDGVCHHGVMDMFRLPKFAAWAYRSQADGEPFGQVASDLQYGDYNGAIFDGVWVFTNSQYVRLYKNDRFVADFYPDQKTFPHLPHPPVRVDDFIGTHMAEDEGLSKADAEVIKRYFACIAGQRAPSPWLLARLGLVMLKNRKDREYGNGLYTKYMVNWGEQSTRWRFEGYDGDRRQWSRALENKPARALKLTADGSHMSEDESWDAMRLRVDLVDEDGTTLPYAFHVVHISLDGPGELIGPPDIALQAGSAAFWVRSIGTAGRLRVSVGCDDFPGDSAELQVRA